MLNRKSGIAAGGCICEVLTARLSAHPRGGGLKSLLQRGFGVVLYYVAYVGFFSLGRKLRGVSGMGAG
ncbi:MAG: hypothetical protein ACLQBD_07220 [Syntrophobacteraceae bacterium]